MGCKPSSLHRVCLWVSNHKLLLVHGHWSQRIEQLSLTGGKALFTVLSCKLFALFYIGSLFIICKLWKSSKITEETFACKLGRFVPRTQVYAQSISVMPKGSSTLPQGSYSNYSTICIDICSESECQYVCWLHIVHTYELGLRNTLLPVSDFP